MKMNGDAKKCCEILNKAGFEAYVVGGTIRDIFLGREVNDIDIATNAKPDQTIKVFEDLGYHIIPLGKKFGTIVVIPEGKNLDDVIEITTYRSEAKYTDRRHPDIIKFETDLIKDLGRRDFTINAMAFDPIKLKLVDPFNGRVDLENLMIRAVRNPRERFNEDPLRMMRMCRFAGKLGFVIEPNTLAAAWKLHELIGEISAERVRDELIKILESDNPTFALHYLIQTQLMDVILPEVARLKGRQQPAMWHRYDVLNHLFQTVCNLPSNKPYLRLAGLLHDIGKVKIAPNPPPFFPKHAMLALPMLEDIFNRLKLDNDNRNYIRFLVKRHMDGFHSMRTITNKSARRYLSKVENILWLPDLLFLIKADVVASGYHKPNSLKLLDNWMKKLNEVIITHQPFAKEDLAVNGYDLMNLGIPPSEVLGKIQQSLLEEVIENPDLNTREYLLKRAQELFNDGR